ncbi:MAG: MFS transporter [Candidatus Methanomethylicus sp.]|nr:MFS transporter [Candidatus Methanomethylicus sp.]
MLDKAQSGIGKITTNLGFSGLPFQIYVLLAITFVLSFGRNISFPYLAIYLTSNVVKGGLGMDPSIVGFMLMVGGLTSILMLLFTGSLCDRIGRRKMMLIYIFPMILLTLSLAFISTPEEFLLRYALMGVIGAFYDPAYSAMVADLVPPNRREEIYGLSYMIANVGTVIGPLIGGALVVSTPYSTLFLITTIFVVLASLMVFFWIKETNPVGECNIVKVDRFGGVYRDKQFLLFCFLGAMTNIVYSQFYGLLSVYTEYIGLPAYEFGLLFSINGAMVVLLQIPIRKGAMRIGSTRAFIIAQSLYAAGFAYFFFARNFMQFLIGNIVLTLGEITFVPANNGFIANLAPVDKRGRYMALSGLFSGLGSSAGNFIGFGFYSVLQFKEYVWAILGGWGFLTLPGYALLHRIHKKRSNVL